jgi:hypothetical protein
MVKIWIRTFYVRICKQKNKEFSDLRKLGQQIRKSQKNIGSANLKSANCLTCGRSTNVSNFESPQICGFSEAWRKMIHEKNLKQKILWHCPFKAKHQRAQECTDVTSQNFIYILSLETIPLKSRVNGFLKRNTYSIKNFHKIISHPFLEYFHRNNSIYKITTPLLWSEGGNLQTDAAQLLLFDPIPAKVKKLGLLSIYKFSLCLTRQSAGTSVLYVAMPLMPIIPNPSKSLVREYDSNQRLILELDQKKALTDLRATNLASVRKNLLILATDMSF